MGRKSRLKREMREGLYRPPRIPASRAEKVLEPAVIGAGIGLVVLAPAVFVLPIIPFHGPRTRASMLEELLTVGIAMPLAGGVGGLVWGLLRPLRRVYGGRTLSAAAAGACVAAILGYATRGVWPPSGEAAALMGLGAFMAAAAERMNRSPSAWRFRRPYP